MAKKFITYRIGYRASLHTFPEVFIAMRPVVLTFFLCTTLCMVAQDEIWENHTSGLVITAIASNDEAVWVGTYGGVLRIETGTGQRSFFDRSNSGLPSNKITSIAVQGADVWIGTITGLAHYNGAEWNTFRTDNSGLQDADVEDVAIGPAGVVWVSNGSLNQVQRFANGQWSTYGIPGWPAMNVHLAVEESGALLVATSNYGLKRLHDEVWTEYETTNSDLPSNNISSIEIAPSGLIHMSSGGNLVTFDGVTFTSHPIPPSGSSSSAVEHIAFDGSGTCYVTTLTYQTGPPAPPEVLFARCLRFVDGTWVDLHRYTGPGSYSYYLGPLAVDAANMIWSGSARLFTYADGVWSMGTLPSCGFVQNGVLDIHCAKDGGVWASIHDLYQERLYRFDGTAWVDRTVGLGSTISIFDVVTDTLGNPILATSTGVHWWNGTTWTTFNMNNSPLPSNYVSRLFVDRSGALWVLPLLNGLLKYNGTWTVYNTGNTGLSSNDVACIAQDDNGVYWIGTGAGAAGGGGLSRFDGNTWTTWTPLNSNLPYNLFVRDIALDSQGVPWLRIYYTYVPDQVAVFDGTEFTFYDTTNSPLPQYLSCLSMGPNDSPYVGTSTNGIQYLDPVSQTWEGIDIANSGIPANGIADLDLAANGDLWVATNFGAGRRFLEMVEDPILDIPSTTTLQVNPSITGDLTNFVIGLPTAGSVRIDVIDMRGRLVLSFGDLQLSAGTHSLPVHVGTMPSGIYTCRLLGATSHASRFCVRH
jgi:ligand-binding sensor domain-containing protein